MILQRYLEVISLIEHVHSNYHGLLKKELAQIGSSDISSAQAAVLFQIGDAKTSTNKLRNRTNHVGSGINGIIQKLIGNGYLLHERSPYDHRMLDVWLSEKGETLYNRLIDLHRRFSEHEGTFDLMRTICTLRNIEQFCIDLELDDEQFRFHGIEGR